MAPEYSFVRMILVRHGQARSRDGMYGPDTPLSDLGQRQAKLVAISLVKESPVAAIYSSPLPRAVETAVPIGEALRLTVAEDARLSELQVDPAPLDQIAAGRNDISIWRPEDRGAKDGETVRDFFLRVGSFCDWACGRHRNEKIVLVAHAGTIDAIFRWAMAVPPDQPWMFELEVPNASITEIEVWPFGRSRSGPPRHSVVYRVGAAGHLVEHGSAI
jgi:probable phosphoglycerate mutase